ncbi:hypothetical protein L798_05906 [Zootermopsis nevadensis]|uniref:Uncharacterized protein n=1 Tax=Zootermopsis nevadensis TaxID=136037 RepID=A0A067RHL5_ZOONE|nr:hypothetical protein L798_05906 [Zootermopsis nevadensis]
MARSILIALLYGFTVCSAAPRKVVELNDIPKVQLSGDGVSTSFGGYHASAGLGGSLDGGPAGGLFAEAGTPDGTGASAGLGGSVGSKGVHFSQAGFGDGTASESDSLSSSSAGAGNHVSRPNKRPAEFYDNIFNIPISVLQAVNQLLGKS